MLCLAPLSRHQMHSSSRSSPYCPPLPFQSFLSLQHALCSVWRVLYGIQKLSTTPFKRARAQADRPPRSRAIKHLAKIGLLYYSPPLCPHMLIYFDFNPLVWISSTSALVWACSQAHSASTHFGTAQFTQQYPLALLFSQDYWPESSVCSSKAWIGGRMTWVCSDYFPGPYVLHAGQFCSILALVVREKVFSHPHIIATPTLILLGISFPFPHCLSTS